MKRIPRRTFTAQFKAEAIKLVTEQKLTHAEVSRKLDIATKSIRTWIDQQRAARSRPVWERISSRLISCAFGNLNASWRSPRWSATS
jgi:transposase-like protein